MKRVALLAILCAAPAMADERRGPDNAYFEGTYEFTGRAPGAEGQFYGGWAIMRDAGDHLAVTRCIGGESETGRLTYEEKGGDRLIFLNGSFWTGAGASCQFNNDNDNYPRLTCYTWPEDDSGIEIPGLESYIPVQWPAPDHAADC